MGQRSNSNFSHWTGMDNKKASAAVIIFDFIIMIVQLLKLPLDRID